MLLRNLLNQLKDQIGQKADLMLTSDDLLITPLKQFYKDVIYNTISQKQKLLTSGKRSAAKYISEILSILIAQFGKNYKADKRISGDDLMNLVLVKIQKAREIIDRVNYNFMLMDNFCCFTF